MKITKNGKYYLYSKDGTKKLGGPYDTESEVWARERQVQYFKRQGKVAMNEKLAKILRMGDIEDRMGFYFNDRQEPTVRRMIGQEYANSFSLRHPVLTGLPTLGIAPAIAKERAINNVVRGVARKDAKARDMFRKHIDKIRQQRILEYKLETQRRKADALPNAVQAAGSAYIQGQMLKKQSSLKSHLVATGVGAAATIGGGLYLDKKLNPNKGKMQVTFGARRSPVEKIANYLDTYFTYPRREYDSPRGKTIYVPRRIEEHPLPVAQERFTQTEAI